MDNVLADVQSDLLFDRRRLHQLALWEIEVEARYYREVEKSVKESEEKAGR